MGASGSLLGFAADTYEDFTGIRESERLPSKIKKLGRKTKLGLAGLLTTISIGATLSIYGSYEDKPKEPVTVENAQYKTIDNLVE